MLPNMVVINITAAGKVANDLSTASSKPTRAEQVTINEIALTINACEMANKGVFRNSLFMVSVWLNTLSCRYRGTFIKGYDLKNYLVEKKCF